MNSISKLALGACVAVGLGTAAAAHATISAPAAAPGSPFTVFITVPHGCAGQPTTEVIVGIPDGFVMAKPLAVPGWVASTAAGEYARAFDLGGVPHAEGVVEVSWSGGSLPDDEAGVFPISGVFADDAEPGRAHFPLLQLCPDGEAAWTDTGEGSDWPAPYVNVGR